MTNKVCYVAVFEDLCRCGDFSVADDIWLKVPSEDEKRADVTRLKGYLGWMESGGDDGDLGEDDGPVCYKYRMRKIKELIDYHEGVPSKDEIADMEVAYDHMWQARRKLLRITLVNNNLNGWRTELHKEANILTNKLQDFVSQLKTVKKREEKDGKCIT